MKKFDKIFKKRLEKILMDGGLINSEIADHAQSTSAESGRLIGDVLVDQGYVKEEDIARELSAQLQLPFLMLENYNISKGTMESLPPELMHRYQVIPVDVFGDTLSLAISQHLSLEAFREIQDKTSLSLTFFVALISKVRDTLKDLVPVDDSKLKEIREQKTAPAQKPASWTDIFDTANKSVMGMDAVPKKDKKGKGLDIFDTANTKVMKNLQPKSAVPPVGAKPPGPGKPKKPDAGGGLDIFDTAQKKGDKKKRPKKK
jgi:hypothetical protein